MTKEYAIDHYGTVRWTIGSGCSGGSLVQQQVANAYPGVYQGITPQCSFTDAWSSAMQYEEYYFGAASTSRTRRAGTRASSGTRSRSRAFFDHPNPANPVTFTTVIPNSRRPDAAAARACRPTRSTTRRPTRKGVRCTLQDYMVNVFGRDARRLRPARLRQRRRPVRAQGAARRALISPAQFVDFNTNIGGADIDLNLTAERTAADPIALERALPHRRDRLGQQPRQGRDHRPARPRPGRLPRRLPHLRDAGAARCATSAPPPTRCCGAARRR